MRDRVYVCVPGYPLEWNSFTTVHWNVNGGILCRIEPQPGGLKKFCAAFEREKVTCQDCLDIADGAVVVELAPLTPAEVHAVRTLLNGGAK